MAYDRHTAGTIGAAAAAGKILGLNPEGLVLELTGKTGPATGLEGKFSMFHCAAVGLVDGAVSRAQFTDDRVRAPEVVAVRNWVKVEVDPVVREDEAMVSMLLRDGRRVQTHVVHASGSRENPLTDDDLKKKFRSFVDGILSADQSEQVIRLVEQLEDIEDAGMLVRACATGEPADIRAAVLG